MEPQSWWFHLGSPRQQRSAGGAAELGSGQGFSHFLPGGAAVSERPQFSCLDPLFPGATLACGQGSQVAVSKQKVPRLLIPAMELALVYILMVKTSHKASPDLKSENRLHLCKGAWRHFVVVWLFFWFGGFFCLFYQKNG